MITWLLCLRKPTAPMIIGITTSILYVPIAVYFVDVLDFGINSFGICFSIQNAVVFLALLFYLACDKFLKPSIFWPRKDSFSGWGEYLKVAIPSCVMTCAEYWCFEVLIVLAGIMGVLEQDCQVLVVTISCMMLQVAFGF